MHADHEYLTTDEAAELLRLAAHTLHKWRCDGAGPPYVRVGRRIVYRRDALREWALDREVRHTGQAVGARPAQEAGA